MLFAIICTYRPGGDLDRMPYRAEHLRYMIQAEPSTVFGGPFLSDDGERSSGMIVVLDLADRQAAEGFVANEPYARQGLFESIVIRRWRQMTPSDGLLQRELEGELARLAAASPSP